MHWIVIWYATTAVSMAYNWPDEIHKEVCAKEFPSAHDAQQFIDSQPTEVRKKMKIVEIEE